jgi:methyltransferase-like protein 23
MYTWPCAPVLAWYLWTHRGELGNKHVLELGAGTSLPGVVAAKCGAQVTLSDCSRFTKCLDNCRVSAAVNGVSDKVRFFNSLAKLQIYVLLINFFLPFFCRLM